MKKVLFISYHFPPSSSTGAIRPMKFVKYLPRFGWKPLVLTCKNSFDFSVQKDMELLRQIPNETTVFRTNTFEPLNYIWKKKNNHIYLKQNKSNRVSLIYKNSKDNFFRKIKGLFWDFFNMPDRYQGWIPFAFFKGLKIITKEDINLIFATAPPYSAFVVGWILSKLTKRPLIIDYRDPWNLAPWARKHFRFFEKINKKIERTILSQAKYIISVNNTIAKDLQQYYTGKSNKHIIISNGYDSEEINYYKTDSSDKLTFLHAGHLYSNDGVADFTNAINDIIEEDLELRENIKILFLGTRPDFPEYHRLEKLGIVEYKGRLPRSECLSIMAKAHILLVFLKKDVSGCLKIFDYMMYRKPVLGIMSKGAVRDLIEKANMGIVVNYGDKEKLKEIIYDFYYKHKKGILKTEFNEDLIKKYNREELTKVLADIFERTVTQN